MKIYQAILIFIMLIAFSYPAQSQPFDNIKKVELTSFGPIYTKDDIAGYFFLINKPKEKGQYILELLDQDLNVVLEYSLNRSPKWSLKEVILHREKYYLKFLNAQKRENIIMVMDLKGVIQFEETLDIYQDPLETDMTIAERIKKRNRAFNIVEGVGVFAYSVHLPRHGKEQYIIHYFGAHEELHRWTFSPKTTSLESAEFIGIKENILLNLVFKETLFGPKVGKRAYIMGIDISTGQEVFSKSLLGEKIGFLPFAFKYEPNTEEPMIAGWFYEIKAAEFLLPKALGIKKPEKDIPGYLFTNVKSDGSLDKVNYLSKKDLNEYSPKRKKEKLARYCLHNLISTKNQEHFYVMETYGGLNQIRDLVLIELDDFFQPLETLTFEKKKKKSNNRALIPTRSSIGNWNQDFYYKEIGFDYSFTVMDESKNNFLIGYLNDGNLKRQQIAGNNKRRGVPSWTVGAIVYHDQEFSTKEIDLASKADDVFLLPAKFGNVVIIEYFKKEKRLEVYKKVIWE